MKNNYFGKFSTRNYKVYYVLTFIYVILHNKRHDGGHNFHETELKFAIRPRDEVIVI